MIVRLFLAISLALAMSACAAVPQGSRTPPPAPGVPVQTPPQLPLPTPAEGFRPPSIQRIAGLEWLFQRDAQALAGLMGTPRLDVAEGDMRKLQFTGRACVLDVFLYPLREGGQPVATHVEARRASDGAEVDRASCAQALRQQ